VSFNAVSTPAAALLPQSAPLVSHGATVGSPLDVLKSIPSALEEMKSSPSVLDTLTAAGNALSGQDGQAAADATGRRLHMPIEITTPVGQASPITAR